MHSKSKCDHDLAVPIPPPITNAVVSHSKIKATEPTYDHRDAASDCDHDLAVSTCSTQGRQAELGGFQVAHIVWRVGSDCIAWALVVLVVRLRASVRRTLDEHT